MHCVLANPTNPWRPSENFIKRIKRSYRIGFAPLNIPAKTTWHTIGNLSADLHAMLMSNGDDSKLVDMLGNPRRSNLYYGMDTLCRSIMDGVLATPIENQSHYAETLAKRVRKLVEALGTVRLYNPEWQGVTETDVPLEDLLQRIDTVLGLHVQFPNPFPDELGISTSRGVASDRAIQAIYQAKRAVDLAKDGRIIEIGGGVGRTAYYANELGCKDYVIVDIPMSLVGQACFLAATLGEESILMEGDEDSSNRHEVTLLSPHALHRAGKANLTLNVDSLTEMGRDHARAYADYCSEHSPVLLSINHETNPFTARELFPTTAWVSRHPYWMREGYVEEVVAF